MLFVPSSIPFMVPEAEAAGKPDAVVLNENPQVDMHSIDRNNITLSWSAPNDNGSPIIKYRLEVQSISTGNWLKAGDIAANSCCQFTDYMTVDKQFSYRIKAYNVNGGSDDWSNIVRVWSFPHGVYGVPQAGQTTDATSPTITVPSNISTTSSDPSGASVTFDVTATDAVGVIGLHPSYLNNWMPETPICSTTSGHDGNPDNYDSDWELPYYSLLQYSNSGWTGSPIFIGHTVNLGFSGHFDIKTTTVTCTATDMSGNTGTDDFTVTVTYTDEILPTVTVPSNISTTSSDPSGASVTFDVTATDNVSVTSGPTCSPASGSLFLVETTTVTCTAYDAAGNTGIETFTVTVTYTAPEPETPSEPEAPSEPETPSEPDTVPPEVLVPNNIVVNAENPNGEVVSFNPQAVDNIDELLTPTCNPQSGSLFQIGTTTVTCTATDSAGNTNTNSFTVTVNDSGFVLPDWIRDVAEYWHDGSINDASFLNAISYLIQEHVIIVPSTDVETEPSATVPSWFKINAGYWASGQIPDETFVNGLQYLIQIGLIQV